MKTIIGVIGSDGKISEHAEKISENIGQEIARNGLVLLCGGRGGVMEAASKGARKGNGLVIGILPGLDKKESNPYLDVALTTGINNARNALVASCSDAVIVINGRIGTLSEIGLALCYDKPVIAVRGTGGVAESAEEKIKEMEIKNKIYTADPDKAVMLAMSLVGKG